MSRHELLPDDVVAPTAQPMIGRRFGTLTVVAFAGRRDEGVVRGARRRHLLWVVRCDCGHEATQAGTQIRYRPGCDACGKRASAATNRRKRSVRLPNGWTIAQVALAYDLPLETVYARWRRGWPVEALSRPLTPRRECPKGSLGGRERVRPAVTQVSP